ncbi:hypothetical protein MACH15_24230 [Maricaulis maris]|nr:hypothetical protein MACH15_24230 [Maricaulis maris]
MKAAGLLLHRAAGARYLIADKGYDANAIRKSLRQAGKVPVIPGRSNRKRKIVYDKARYRDRHLVENAFCRIKDFRRVATRYDKLARNFLFEPPRVSWRLQPVRRRSHHGTTYDTISGGGSRAGCPAGSGSSERSCFAMGSDWLGGGEDRMHGGDAAPLGPAG